jgi:hypothetical protein
MGKASRRRRQQQAGHPSRQPAPAPADPRAAAQAAMGRLLRTNAPGRVSLAGAYALGFGGLGLAQQSEDGPDWFHELDPLDTLFLGTVWPRSFRDVYEFGNARTAWLRLMRAAPHWRGIELFVNEVVAASQSFELPIDDGELMLLAAGRLEDAGLDQRKVPAGLLPGNALTQSRVTVGPKVDMELPLAPADATDRVARFWTSTEVPLPHDGTPVDALRQGLHVLASMDLDVRHEVTFLLPALYVALVGRDAERLDEAGERAEVWAWGLPEASPLVAVVDVMMTAMHRNMLVDQTLGALFAVPTFDQLIPPADLQFTADPGTAFVTLAFELGHRQVITLDSKVVRLDQGSNAMLHAQLQAFEDKFGRPPGPNDPIFFDPDADEPRPIQVVDLEQQTTAMLQAAGICDAWIYASQHTDGLLPRPDGCFNSDADRRDWDRAINRYRRTHPDEIINDEAELSKLRTALAIASIHGAASDPAIGASLARRLDSDDELDDEAEVVAEFLERSALWLNESLASPDIVTSATELARAWSGVGLATRVCDVSATRDRTTDPDLSALFAVAVTTLTKGAP